MNLNNLITEIEDQIKVGTVWEWASPKVIWTMVEVWNPSCVWVDIKWQDLWFWLFPKYCVCMELEVVADIQW